ncbi:MAG: 3-hydroxyacyl-CoA dehydrogenase/enoyl-CoA hydratase/3-hydroxybutyryl-CoA epimerase, partial [Planctomycetota bacterium]
MIDIQGLPLPENVPAEGSCVRIERPEPGLCVLVLDPPHREHTLIDLPVLRDLDLALDQVATDSTLRGLVITGRTPLHFAYGADLDAIASITEPRVVERVIELGHQVFGRIEQLKNLTTVAAVGGPVLGGAYELALSCNLIVLADHDKTRVGLPETQLGILPAWGGSHRLPRRIGVVAALGAILKGKRFVPRQARKNGMVDRLTHPEYLMRVASDLALGRERIRKRSRGLQSLLIDRNPIATQIIAKRAREGVLEQTKGRYPAALEVIDIVCKAPRTSMREGAIKEAQAGGRLATGPVAKNLIALFFSSEAAKKLAVAEDGSRPAPIKSAGVIGGGVMGAAIASLFAERGVATRLADLDSKALDRALLEHQAVIGKKRKRRQLRAHQANAALDRLDVSVGTVGFQHLEVVVEAVAERLEVKQAVFGALSREMQEGTIFATNTSSLAVADIAEGLPHPRRVVGLHFFNPVRRMPLVEIVRGPKTAPGVVRSAAALALRLGKTPVVVSDVAGFLVNRILGPYLDEALRLFEGGVDPARIDRACEEFGMPMGPLRLLDEVGFDIASHAAESLHSAYGDRMQPTGVLSALMSEQRLGKKTGNGFYRHSSGKKSKKAPKPVLNDDLARFQKDAGIANMTAGEIVDRCVFAMLNEGARCLEEDVVAGPAELDLATVFGMGFAPFRGGLLRYADSCGVSNVHERCRALAQAPDVAARGAGAQRFEPTALLERLANEGGSFYGNKPAAEPEAQDATP